MNVWCKGHEVSMAPQPSGFFPTATWQCPTESAEIVTLGDITTHAGNPALLAGVVFHYEPAKRRKRLVGIPAKW